MEWSESVAVGSEAFVRDIQTRLDIHARHRQIKITIDSYSEKPALLTQPTQAAKPVTVKLSFAGLCSALRADGKR